MVRDFYQFLNAIGWHFGERPLNTSGRESHWSRGSKKSNLSILFNRDQKNLYAFDQILFRKALPLLLLKLSEGTGNITPQGILDGMIDLYKEIYYSPIYDFHLKLSLKLFSYFLGGNLARISSHRHTNTDKA